MKIIKHYDIFENDNDADKDDHVAILTARQIMLKEKNDVEIISSKIDVDKDIEREMEKRIEDEETWPEIKYSNDYKVKYEGKTYDISLYLANSYKLKYNKISGTHDTPPDNSVEDTLTDTELIELYVDGGEVDKDKYKDLRSEIIKKKVKL